MESLAPLADVVTAQTTTSDGSSAAKHSKIDFMAGVFVGASKEPRPHFAYRTVAIALVG